MSQALLYHLYLQTQQVRSEVELERDPRVVDCLRRSLLILESTATLAHLQTQQAQQLDEMTALMGQVEQEIRRLRRPWWARLLGIGG